MLSNFPKLFVGVAPGVGVGCGVAVGVAAGVGVGVGVGTGMGVVAAVAAFARGCTSSSAAPRNNSENAYTASLGRGSIRRRMNLIGSNREVVYIYG